MERTQRTPLDFALLNHDDDLYGASLALSAQQPAPPDEADHPVPVPSAPVSALASAGAAAQ